MEENQNLTEQQETAESNGAYSAPSDYGSPETESGFTQNNTYSDTEGAGSGTTQSSTFYNGNQNPYGNGYQTYNSYTAYGTTATPVDQNGNPLKNHFGLKITFCILEILCCCMCNPLSFGIGIIALVLVCIANDRYKKGMTSEFKGMALASTILLWVGFATIVFSIFFWVISSISIYEETKNAVENGSYRDWEDFSEEDLERYLEKYLDEELFDSPRYDQDTLEKRFSELQGMSFDDYTNGDCVH